MKKKKIQSGFLAVTTVLLVSALTLAITVGVSKISIGEVLSSFSYTKAEQSLSFVEGCMEDALLKIHDSASYSGGTITRPEGSCTITASSVGSTWTVTATSSDTYKKTVQVVATRGSSLVLTSWQEL